MGLVIEPQVVFLAGGPAQNSPADQSSTPDSGVAEFSMLPIKTLVLPVYPLAPPRVFSGKSVLLLRKGVIRCLLCLGRS